MFTAKRSRRKRFPKPHARTAPHDLSAPRPGWHIYYNQRTWMNMSLSPRVRRRRYCSPSMLYTAWGWTNLPFAIYKAGSGGRGRPWPPQGPPRGPSPPPSTCRSSGPTEPRGTERRRVSREGERPGDSAPCEGTRAFSGGAGRGLRQILSIQHRLKIYHLERCSVTCARPGHTCAHR